MEHAVSDLLVDRIDKYLDYPQVDPHGDPIPRADGSLDEAASQVLSACTVGYKFRLARVKDQSPEFLRFLTETGLSLGAKGRVTANRPEAGIVTVVVDGKEATLGRDVADKVLVAEIETAVRR
jgi:DtxR family Mn-dependent transcriptional regulator